MKFGIAVAVVTALAALIFARRLKTRKVRKEIKSDKAASLAQNTTLREYVNLEYPHWNSTFDQLLQGRAQPPLPAARATQVQNLEQSREAAALLEDKIDEKAENNMVQDPVKSREVAALLEDKADETAENNMVQNLMKSPEAAALLEDNADDKAENNMVQNLGKSHEVAALLEDKADDKAEKMEGPGLTIAVASPGIGNPLSYIPEDNPSLGRRGAQAIEAERESRYWRKDIFGAVGNWWNPDEIAAKKHVGLAKLELSKALDAQWDPNVKGLFVEAFAKLKAVLAAMDDTQAESHVAQSPLLALHAKRDHDQLAAVVFAALNAVEAKDENAMDNAQAAFEILREDCKEADAIDAIDAAIKALEEARPQWRYDVQRMDPTMAKILGARKAYKKALKAEKASGEKRQNTKYLANEYRICHPDKGHPNSREQWAQWRYQYLVAEKNAAAEEAENKRDAAYHADIAAIWVESLQGGTEIAAAKVEQRNEKMAVDVAAAEAAEDCRDAGIAAAEKAWRTAEVVADTRNAEIAAAEKAWRTSEVVAAARAADAAAKEAWKLVRETFQ